MSEVDLKELLDEARERFQARDYAAAEKILDRVIATSHPFADVHNMLGVIYHDGGKFARALEAFQEALRINPSYTEACLNLAVTYNDLGMYNEARAVYARAKHGTSPAPAASGGRAMPSSSVAPASREHPIDPFVKGKLANMHAELGDIYADLLQFAAAETEYRKALALRPDFPDIRTSLGKALREGGKKEQALHELLAAKKLKAEYAPAGIQLGVTYYALGRIPEAQAEWNGVLKYEPQNPRARMFLKLVTEMDKAKP